MHEFLEFAMSDESTSKIDNTTNGLGRRRGEKHKSLNHCFKDILESVDARSPPLDPGEHH